MGVVIKWGLRGTGLETPILEEDSLIVVGAACLTHSPFPSSLGTKDCHPLKPTLSKVPFCVFESPNH